MINLDTYNFTLSLGFVGSIPICLFKSVYKDESYFILINFSKLTINICLLFNVLQDSIYLLLIAINKMIVIPLNYVLVKTFIQPVTAQHITVEASLKYEPSAINIIIIKSIQQVVF